MHSPNPDMSQLFADRQAQRSALHNRHLNEQFVRVLKTIGYDVGFQKGQGQYLYEMAAKEEEAAGGEPRFPNREIEVTRLPHSGRVVALRCLGEAFEPSRVRGPLPGDEYLPEDGELVPARLATLDDDLRRLESERGSRQR